MKTLLLIMGFLWNALEELAILVIGLFEKKKAFQAEFGKISDIGSPFNRGFVISRSRKLTRKQSYEGLLVAGPTGSGKTAALLSRTIWSLKNCSMIINDPSGELYPLTSGHLSKTHRILTLNFSDSCRSFGYNPLLRIRKKTDANKVAEMLVSATQGGGNGDPFWRIQSQAAITLFIQLLLHQEPEYRNMANLVDLINRFASAPKAIDLLVKGTGDDRLIAEYKALIAFPQKTLQNITASVKASLQIFTDEEVARVTAFDSIDFEEFRKTPTVLYIHNSIADQRYFSVLTGLFFEDFYKYLLSEIPGKEALDVFFILEEASSIRIPLLSLALANLRKYRSGSIICVQSPSQLRTLYGQDYQNIESNCLTKIFLSGQTDREVLNHLENLSGKHIVTDDKGVDRVSPLISADEIRVLPKNRSLIIASNNKVIKGRISPYYKSLRYRSLAEIPPPPLVGDIPEEDIPMLLYDLEHPKDENQEPKTA